MKAILFLILVGGFYPMTSHWQDGTESQKYQMGSSSYFDCNAFRTSYADVYTATSNKELMALLKKLEGKDCIIVDLQNGTTITYSIKPIIKKWKEEIDREEIVDYEIELK